MNIWTSPVTPIVILVVAIAAIVGVMITASSRVKKERKRGQENLKDLQLGIRRETAQAYEKGYSEGRREGKIEGRREEKLSRLPRDKGDFTSRNKDENGRHVADEPDVKSRANKTNLPKLPGKTFRERAQGIRRPEYRGNNSSGSTTSHRDSHYDDGSNMLMGGILGASMFSNSTDPEPTRSDPTPAPDPSPSSSWSSDSGGSSSSYDSGSSSSSDSGSFGGGDSGSF